MFFKASILVLLKVTVVVYHSDAVPDRVLARAENLAGAIFRQAGIELQWRPANASDTALRPTEIALHLLPAAPPNLSPNSEGFAVLMPEEGYAGISCPTVAHLAAALETDESTVLGAVIAHELGHLLTGSGSHSPGGVMAARPGRRELQAAARGELRFQAEEARRLRAEASRRATILR
jgi:hypothetical protein